MWESNEEREGDRGRERGREGREGGRPYNLLRIKLTILLDFAEKKGQNEVRVNTH